ncbi:MAG: hypothetical protein VW450_00535 [Chloroflexota bacterium]
MWNLRWARRALRPLAGDQRGALLAEIVTVIATLYDIESITSDGSTV